jgi:cytochrome c oxidase subunit 3
MGHSADGGNAGHDDHPAHLQHHFDTEEQQFESGKLGMWLFLATEILLFGGLFCAYAIYRAHHPEIFIYAHKYLDKTLGGINTVVLLCSSLTMAWAVRAAQLGQKKLLIWLLSLTILGGFGFMGIKYVEYEHKWKSGLLPGRSFDPQEHGEEGDAHAETATEIAHAEEAKPIAAEPEPEPEVAARPEGIPEGLKIEPSTIPPPAEAPTGTTAAAAAAEPGHEPEDEPANVHIFFGIYFAMTGLHGVHVIAGMIAIGWALRKAVRGDFDGGYYTPVDLVGLYWHLVDMIWIYLFPLLYLIH